MQMPAYFMSPKMEKKGKRFFVTSAKLHILESPLRFWDERRGKKDKKSKVHPLFPSSHHDIYARAHTHDPRQYS